MGLENFEIKSKGREMSGRGGGGKGGDDKVEVNEQWRKGEKGRIRGGRRIGRESQESEGKNVMETGIGEGPGREKQGAGGGQEERRKTVNIGNVG